jgi:phage baseplate assembly protein W|tara:strand:+ start:274 stop:657 length:384 start_codon:yes stop_codon:yes gene_type:complete
MSGIAPKLPITLDKEDGIALIKNYNDLVTQNLKMLVLTAPGEKMMDPDFGVGARNYLFEQMTQATFEDFKSKLLEQQQRYLPYLTIRDVQFASSLTNPNMNENLLGIKITYFNKVLKSTNVLLLPVS